VKWAREPLVLLALVVVALVFSGIGAGRFGSFLAEAAPAVLGISVLVVTWPRFRFTPLVYRLVWPYRRAL
jgi:putative membrane protein